MKRLLLMAGLLLPIAAMAGVVQRVYTGLTPTTNATAAVVHGGDGAGFLRRVIWTIPSVSTNLTVTISELDGTAMLTSNQNHAVTNGSYTLTWTTNLIHGSYQISAGGAGWTNYISGTTTSTVVPTISVDILEEK